MSMPVNMQCRIEVGRVDWGHPRKGCLAGVSGDYRMSPYRMASKGAQRLKRNTSLYAVAFEAIRWYNCIKY